MRNWQVLLLVLGIPLVCLLAAIIRRKAELRVQKQASSEATTSSDSCTRSDPARDPEGKRDGGTSPDVASDSSINRGKLRSTEEQREFFSKLLDRIDKLGSVEAFLISQGIKPTCYTFMLIEVKESGLDTIGALFNERADTIAYLRPLLELFKEQVHPRLCLELLARFQRGLPRPDNCDETDQRFRRYLDDSEARQTLRDALQSSDREWAFRALARFGGKEDFGELLRSFSRESHFEVQVIAETAPSWNDDGQLEQAEKALQEIPQESSAGTFARDVSLPIIRLKRSINLEQDPNVRQRMILDGLRQTLRQDLSVLPRQYCLSWLLAIIDDSHLALVENELRAFLARNSLVEVDAEIRDALDRLEK